MKTTVYLFFLIVFFSSCYPTASTRYAPFQSSNEQYKQYYKKYMIEGERLLNSWYHYTTSQGADGENVVRTFFPETNQMTSYTEYKTMTYRVKDGLSKRWYDNGNQWEEGNYKEGEKDGIWKVYSYQSNTLKSTGLFATSKKTGTWKYYDKEKRLTSEVSFLEGVKEGAFVEYDSLGNTINSGVYKADTIYEQTTESNQFSEVETLPYMSAAKGITNEEDRKRKSNEIFLQGIYKNIRYPEDARKMGVEGTAITRFVIEKDGSINDIEVLSGLCQSIAKECKRVISELPKWEPGTQDGEPVRVYFNAPIRFRLE
ncbi:MAG: energy transducer TonB [Saprospiraceae bacterium]